MPLALFFQMKEKRVNIHIVAKYVQKELFKKLLNFSDT